MKVCHRVVSVLFDDPIRKCLGEIGSPFDGDEMNIHIPQSVEAEVEAMINSRCAFHIVSSQHNAPVCGAVQDTLVSLYLMTNHWNDGSVTLISKDIALKIYQDCNISQERLENMMQRAIEYYPEHVIYREIISEIDASVSHVYEFAEEIPGTLFASILFPNNFGYSRNIDHDIPDYTEVKIDDGIMHPNSGPLCKLSIGSKGGSIVHMLWKRSPELALKFLSDVQHLGDYWLPTHGFSMGFADCFASSSEGVARILMETRYKVDQILQHAESPEKAENEISIVLNSAMAVGPTLAKGSMMKGDRNALNVMRVSGGKGSVINLAQIVAFVGQQNIRGARMPCQLSHNSRCLPSFLPNDNSPEARGFIVNNYITGLTPQEAFYHAGAGREGVISTALKSVTGETEIVIIEKNTPKSVKIGDWIDELLRTRNCLIEHYTESEMELLNVEDLDLKIPTTDSYGNVSWGKIKNVTRHNPGKELFYIKTLSGKEVTVTESKSLLVWDKNKRQFLKKDSPLVRLGDFVPITSRLPILVRHNMKEYFPVTDYVHNASYIVTKNKLHLSECSDVLKDEIIEIRRVEIVDYVSNFPQYNAKVYDLTVPSTLNFGLANGLHVVDTADTGYVQKRIGRKMEDHKVWVDGTVRDANGSIVSFMYGDDGMEAKKLVTVKGLNCPFFVNPSILARQLNSDAKQQKLVNPLIDKPRKLKEEEIEFLITHIYFSKIESAVIQLTTQNAHDNLRIILRFVEIYECKIADLCMMIRDIYQTSKAQYGLMCGLQAMSAIGEPATQMALNDFHFAGVFKGKGANVGFPRLNELANATKTADQRKSGCIIYFNNDTIKENAKIVSQLKSLDDEESKNAVKKAKETSRSLILSFKKEFEEIYVKDFLTDFELKYLPEDVNIEIGASPTELLTYEEYKEEWWVTLSKKLDMRGDYEVQPNHWVILLIFDVEKLFRHRLELEDIALAIEEKSNHNMTCVTSPDIIGRIEVYINLCDLKTYAETKIELPPDAESSRDQLLTDDNINYYICREVAVNFIKTTQIGGVKGIKKTYPREDLDTNEWVMDADGINFIGVLTMPGVDATRTVCDDMHSNLAVLGIEAARRFIFLEAKRVISAGGSYINSRHISLLADSMTINGKITAASRDGISRDVGPNAKIMFEKSVDNAIHACAFGEIDNMASLASAVMYGKLSQAGSGSVIIRNKEKVSNK